MIATRAPMNATNLNGFMEAQESPYAIPQVGDESQWSVNSMADTVTGWWNSLKDHVNNSLFGDSIFSDGQTTPSNPDAAPTPDVQTPDIQGQQSDVTQALTPQTMILVAAAGFAIYLAYKD